MSALKRPDLVCWKCGASLAELPLPLSRLAECPKCRAYQHVCRLCVHYAPGRPKACNEQDAEEVTDKEHANFCGWFEPRDKAFKAGATQARAGVAKATLDNLFGATNDNSGSKEDVAKSELDKLFRDKPR
jgi:hypothetical protein